MTQQEQQAYNQYFFNQQTGTPDMRPQVDPNFAFNLMIFEIANNWEHIKETDKLYKEGKLKTIDQMQSDCLNFIMTTFIKLETYANEDDFVKLTLKKLG
jgi:hypothetical protein